MPWCILGSRSMFNVVCETSPKDLTMIKRQNFLSHVCIMKVNASLCTLGENLKQLCGCIHIIFCIGVVWWAQGCQKWHDMPILQ
jgi:hypothetical protein